tara:strand:- start:114 stop:626 length:513 start_codon:yes stop_codon:yes gene_type:complete
MLIHSDKNVGEDIDFDNLCLICYDNLESNSNVVKLKCGHRYHYDCILQTYKTINGKKKCPYCRCDGGYLPIKPGLKPIKNIHKEYNKEGIYNITYIPNKCKFILQKGKNKGCQCSFNIKTPQGYCLRHQKIKDKENSLITEPSQITQNNNSIIKDNEDYNLQIEKPIIIK